MPEMIEVTATPDPGDLAFVGDSLAAYNDATVGPSGRLALAVFLRDDAGAIVGGLSGYTAWGWLYVQWLWLDTTQRGKGQAGALLETAEREAVARGCHGATIDTFNPAAARAYERQGYRRFGTLEEFPRGRSRIYLQKPLGP